MKVEGFLKEKTVEEIESRYPIKKIRAYDSYVMVFLEDDKIQISDEAYDLAVKKALGEQLDNISISKITEKRLILKRLLPEVKYFNVGLATQLVNDTLLYFEYIMGNTILCSLRVGHIIEANDKKNNK